MFPIDHSQNYEQGTLKINPELANLDIVDLLGTRDLDFDVQLVETGYTIPVTGETVLSGSHSVIRKDTGEELGFGFTDGYTPVSYIEGLNGVFGNLKKLGGIPTRLIKLDNGARAAIQFILPESYWVAGLEHKLFAQLFMGHNGKQGILFNSSETRIICGNTYAMAKASKELRYSARHTSNVTNALKEIQAAVFKVEETAQTFFSFLNTAAGKKVDDNAIGQFVQAMIVNKNPDSNNKGVLNRQGDLALAIATSVNERNGSYATAEDLFSGVTRYVNYRQQGRNEDEQFNYALNSTMPENALEYIREIV